MVKTCFLYKFIITFQKALFLKRLIGQLSKLINDDSTIVLTPKCTIIFYKVFSMFSIIIEKSTTKTLKKSLRENYQEEFK